MTKNEVATRNAGVATEAPPDFLNQYAGKGNENVTRQDMVLPRLGIIQALSPQLQRNDPLYIKGAEIGDIFNTVTGDLYKAGVALVNCHFVKEYAVFKQRTKGGGYRGSFPTEAEARNHMAAQEDAQDCEVIEQAIHYVIVLDEDKNPVTEAAMVFASTKFKISKKWNSLIELNNPKQIRFQKVWKLGTVEEKNQKGTFYNYLPPTPNGWVSEAIATAANALYEAVKGGVKTVDRGEAHTEEQTEF